MTLAEAPLEASDHPQDNLFSRVFAGPRRQGELGGETKFGF